MYMVCSEWQLMIEIALSEAEMLTSHQGGLEY